jgi:hypothetical protein
MDESNLRKKLKKTLKEIKKTSEIDVLLNPIGMPKEGIDYLNEIFEIGFWQGVNTVQKLYMDELKKLKEDRTNDTMYG